MSKDESGTKSAEALVAPYLPFKTFQTALDRLHEGMPHQIDKSVFPTFSFSTIPQLLSGFKFFGLIDEKGVPQADLKALAGVKEQDRQPIMRKLLEKRYSEVMEIDLTKATPTQLEEAIKNYNVTGTTHRKAVTCFLQAAKFAKLPMSHLLEAKTTRGVKAGTTRKRRAKTNGNSSDAVDVPPPAKAETNAFKAITL